MTFCVNKAMIITAAEPGSTSLWTLANIQKRDIDNGRTRHYLDNQRDFQ
jgi:hypothetical protein